MNVAVKGLALKVEEVGLSAFLVKGAVSPVQLSGAIEMQSVPRCLRACVGLLLSDESAGFRRPACLRGS